MKKGKEKDKNTFKLLYKYLKHDKFKLLLYAFLCICVYLPDVLAGIIVGKGLEFLILKDFHNFVLYLILYDGFFILSYVILNFPKEYLYNYLEIKFMRNVMKDMYDKYQNLPAIAYEENGVGELINRLYSDPERIMELLNRIIRLFCKLGILIFVLIISFKISLLIGIELIIFMLIVSFITYKYYPIIKESQRNIRKETDQFVKETTENLSGIREIKALGIKENIKRLVNRKVDNMAHENMKVRLQTSKYYTFTELVFYTLQFIILLTCAYLFVQGHIVYSVYMMIQTYLWRIDEVASSFSEFEVNFSKVKVSLQRLDDFINNRLYDDVKFGNVRLTNPVGKVEFKNVSFKYRDDENNTLNNLSLEFNVNQKNAVVGRSGNGKSTLFNLLLRYFDTKEGVITIDGYDIKSLDEKTLRNTISVIRQSPFIFNMSIVDNFRIVKPSVTLKEIREVCKKAYIDDYIMSLPKKYNTIIGEGGINLSGGQKQRMAIARTLLLNTKIILFDEATSALDNESQKYIKKTIDNLVKDHTIIIVAHRLSTIIDADKIYVIDKGSLVGSGTHEQLLKNRIYKKLYKDEDMQEK